MSEQKTTDPFETRVADLVRGYTDVAAARPVDALAISRAAMAPGRATGLSRGGLDVGRIRRRLDGGRWAAAAVAVVLVAVVGIAVWSRPSNSGIAPTPSASSAPSPAASAVGPVPEVIRHLWQRPLPIAPGPAWATAYLVLTDGFLGVGPDQLSASHSVVAAAGPDTLVVTATPETVGCAVGDLGVYRFTLAGKDTFVTLTAVGADACATREAALAGPWARADLPPPSQGEGVTLSPGTYLTTGFDPFTDDATPGRLSYTVPAGWKVKEDASTSFVLHHLPDASPGQPATDTFIFMIARPRLAAAFEDGAVCGEFPVEPGAGRGVDDIVGALRARPGVIATPPTAVTVGGYEGTLIDLRLDPTWTGGCTAPDGPIVGVPILTGPGAGAGPSVGLGANAPVRLILVDVGAGRTMAIVVACAEPSTLSLFDEQVAQAMPIIESLELHPPTP